MELDHRRRADHQMDLEAPEELERLKMKDRLDQMDLLVIWVARDSDLEVLQRVGHFGVCSAGVSCAKSVGKSRLVVFQYW